MCRKVWAFIVLYAKKCWKWLHGLFVTPAAIPFTKIRVFTQNQTTSSKRQDVYPKIKKLKQQSYEQ